MFYKLFLLCCFFTYVHALPLNVTVCHFNGEYRQSITLSSFGSNVIPYRSCTTYLKLSYTDLLTTVIVNINSNQLVFEIYNSLNTFFILGDGWNIYRRVLENYDFYNTYPNFMIYSLVDATTTFFVYSISNNTNMFTISQKYQFSDFYSPQLKLTFNDTILSYFNQTFVLVDNPPHRIQTWEFYIITNTTLTKLIIKPTAELLYPPLIVSYDPIVNSTSTESSTSWKDQWLTVTGIVIIVIVVVCFFLVVMIARCLFCREAQKPLRSPIIRKPTRIVPV